MLLSSLAYGVSAAPPLFICRLFKAVKHSTQPCWGTLDPRLPLVDQLYSKPTWLQCCWIKRVAPIYGTTRLKL